MFQKWPSIEGLHNVVRSFRSYQKAVDAGEIEKWKPGTWTPPTLTYRGKIKIDGTNAGVRVEDGKVYAQSRTRDVGAVDVDSGNPDNAGFAAWVRERADWFRARGLDIQAREGVGPVIFFGEWSGPGIQKGGAIHKIEKKVFLVFGIQHGAEDAAKLMVDPDLIAQALGPDLPEDVFILPWHGDEITIDFNDRDSLEAAVDNINAVIQEVEKADPWVKATFGVEGVGEGVVYYPITGNVRKGFENRDRIAKPMFKAKGEKHKVQKTRKKQAVQVDPEVLNSINEFVDAFVTENRCRQGVTEACGGTFDPKLTGKFLGWVSQDVKKESSAELEASGLTWKQVSKAVQAAARTWYLEQARKI